MYSLFLLSPPVLPSVLVSKSALKRHFWRKCLEQRYIKEF